MARVSREAEDPSIHRPQGVWILVSHVVAYQLTAAFLSICTCVTSQLMVGFIPKWLIYAWRQIDLIRATAAHGVIHFSKCPGIIRPTQEGLVGIACAEYIIVFPLIDQVCVIQVYCASQLSPEQVRSSLSLFASSAMI